MFQYHCLNQISKIGLENFTEAYKGTSEISEADGVLVEAPPCMR